MVHYHNGSVHDDNNIIKFYGLKQLSTFAKQSSAVIKTQWHTESCDDDQLTHKTLRSVGKTGTDSVGPGLSPIATSYLGYRSLVVP